MFREKNIKKNIKNYWKEGLHFAIFATAKQEIHGGCSSVG